ncbi:MAG: helix-turn-helix domain-containing protein [Alphaproteobacteria bacterium]|nr:helix-turn-helix domain-containing protein [Alphaproteobacteria bacterium]
MSGKQFTPNEYDMLVGRMLMTMRMRLGLSQKDVAARAGVTFQQIQKYETGGNRITAGRLYQIVTKCFGMTMSQFLGETNQPYNHSLVLTDIIRTLDSTDKDGQKLAMQIIACIATAHPKSAQN